MGVLRLLGSVLVTVGALNWGLVGARHLDLVKKTFGEDTKASRIVYALVGLAGLYHITKIKKEAELKSSETGAMPA